MHNIMHLLSLNTMSQHSRCLYTSVKSILPRTCSNHIAKYEKDKVRKLLLSWCRNMFTASSYNLAEGRDLYDLKRVESVKRVSEYVAFRHDTTPELHKKTDASSSAYLLFNRFALLTEDNVNDNQGGLKNGDKNQIQTFNIDAFNYFQSAIDRFSNKFHTDSCNILENVVDQPYNKISNNEIEENACIFTNIGGSNTYVYDNKRNCDSKFNKQTNTRHNCQSDLLTKSQVYYCSANETNVQKKPPKKTTDNLPTLDQLSSLQDHFAKTLPRFMPDKTDFNIYTEDLIFENNWAKKPYVLNGVVNYQKVVQLLKMKLSLTHTRVKVKILKSTVHEDEGLLKIRWHVSALPQIVLLMFWKVMPWNYKTTLETEIKHFDGLSTFYVNDTGKIYKHKVDRVIADEETVIRSSEKKAKLIEKLKKITAAPSPAPTLTK